MARCLQSIQLSFGVLVLLLADRFDPVQDFWGVERCGGSVNVLVKYAHATNVRFGGNLAVSGIGYPPMAATQDFNWSPNKRSRALCPIKPNVIAYILSTHVP